MADAMAADGEVADSQDILLCSQMDSGVYSRNETNQKTVKDEPDNITKQDVADLTSPAQPPDEENDPS